jgi:hypothetical protein
LPEFSSKNSTKNIVTDAVTIPLTTVYGRNQLPDIERMTNKRFRRILLGDPSVTPDYTTGVTLEQAQNLYLTLRKGSYSIFENVPVMFLYQLAMLQKTEFQNIIFDFQSSYITIGGDGTIEDVEENYIGKSVFFNMQYEK